MASESDVLRMSAEIVDKFSPALKAMTSELRKFGEFAKKGNRETQDSSKASEKTFFALRREVTQLTTHVRDFMRPQLNELGLGLGRVGVSATAAGVGIAAAIAAVREFGGVGRTIQDVATGTGFLASQVQVLDEVAKRTGVSTDAMHGSLKDYSDLLVGTSKNLPQISQRWFQFQQDLMARTGHTPGERMPEPAEMLNRMRHDAMVALSSGNPTFIRDALVSMGLPPEWANKTKAELNKAFDDAIEVIKKRQLDIQKSIGVFNVFKDLGSAIDTLSLKFGEAISPAIKDAVEHTKDWVTLTTDVGTAMGAVVTALTTIAKAYGILRRDIGKKGLIGGLFLPSEEGKATLEKNAPDILHKGREALGLPAEGYPLMPKALGWLKDKWNKSDAVSTVYEGVKKALDDFGRSPGDGGAPGMIGGKSWARFGGDVKGFRPGGGTGAHGNEVPPGSGPTSGLTANKAKIAETVASELRAAGASESTVAGIMRNIPQETNWDPSSRSPDQPHFGGEAHFAHGLFQEGGSNWNLYKGWLDKNYPNADWRDPSLQTRFVANNLKSRYPGVWKKMQEGSNVEAATAFLKGYLRPAPQFQAMRESGFRQYGVKNWPKRLAPPAANKEQFGPPMPPPPATFKERFDASYGKQSSTPADLGKQSSLLDNARGAGVLGNLNGTAKIEVSLAGFPPGIKHGASSDGLFKEVKISRGMSMVPADDGA